MVILPDEPADGGDVAIGPAQHLASDLERAVTRHVHGQRIPGKLLQVQSRNPLAKDVDELVRIVADSGFTQALASPDDQGLARF